MTGSRAPSEIDPPQIGRRIEVGNPAQARQTAQSAEDQRVNSNAMSSREACPKDSVQQSPPSSETVYSGTIDFQDGIGESCEAGGSHQPSQQE
jgi:hypothetical protein